MGAVAVVAVMSLATTGAALGAARSPLLARLGGAWAAGLAAAVMLWVAVFEIAPGALADLGPLAALATMAAGAAAVVIASRIGHQRLPVAGVGPVLGVALVVHDLPEGFALGAIIAAGGLVAAAPALVALTLHNLPEKLAFFTADTRSVLPTWLLVVAATVPEPLGALAAVAGAAAAPGVLAAATAAAGGMMAAVALGTLPEVARQSQAMRSFMTAGVAGATMMAGLTVVLPMGLA